MARRRRHAMYALLLLLLVALTTISVSHAFILCPRSKLAYFHCAKSGGSSMNEYLTGKNKNAAWNDCKRVGWGITDAYYDDKHHHNNETTEGGAVRFDAAHVTPHELDMYLHHAIGDLSKIWNEFDFPSPEEIIRDWNTFTVVRNPYLRTLGAYSQRKVGAYDTLWGNQYPHYDFEKMMAYIDNGLRTRELNWRNSPTLTHFRPATLYTHWDNDLPIFKTVLKLEEIAETFPPFLKSFYPSNATLPGLGFHKGKNEESKRRYSLCMHSRGCFDLKELLDNTAHTIKTIRIVNRLYRRDFELLGYNMLQTAITSGGETLKHKNAIAPSFQSTDALYDAIGTTRRTPQVESSAAVLDASPLLGECFLNVRLPFVLGFLCLMLMSRRRRQCKCKVIG